MSRPSMRAMSTAARITWLAVGSVAVTLILAAAISAAMEGGNLLPTLGHTVAIRATGDGEPQPGDDRGKEGVTVPPATIVPAPQPTDDPGQVEPEPEPGDDQDGDRDRGDVSARTVAQATSDGRGPGDGRGSGDGHGSGGGGRDGGRG
jgi:uncharacterized membrane protein YgcG